MKSRKQEGDESFKFIKYCGSDRIRKIFSNGKSIIKEWVLAVVLISVGELGACKLD